MSPLVPQNLPDYIKDRCIDCLKDNPQRNVFLTLTLNDQKVLEMWLLRHKDDAEKRNALEEQNLKIHEEYNEKVVRKRAETAPVNETTTAANIEDAFKSSSGGPRESLQKRQRRIQPMRQRRQHQMSQRRMESLELPSRPMTVDATQ